jgi:hypothetical protein
MGYRKNDIVMIYEDLIENKPEGEARLIRQIKFREQDCTEFWQVKFLEDGSTVYRWLKAAND